MKLITVGLLVLSLCCLAAVAEVVLSFAATCSMFFIKDQNNRPIIPSVLGNTKQICQIWKNKYRYATLYDTASKTPIYSAFCYNGYRQAHRRSTWNIEPQLDDPTKGKEMAREDKTIKTLGQHQALNADYVGSTFQKGHLYPVCQNCDQDTAESTFTLTNAAPQTASDNKQWYHRVERPMTREISNRCQMNTAHVVTGLVPGNKFIAGNVVRPSHFWTAFCCKDLRGTGLISKGFLASLEPFAIMTLTQGNLDIELQKFTKYGRSFQVFGGICVWK